MTDKLAEYLSARVGAETPGDTLIRLSKSRLKVYQPNGEVDKSSSEEWCSWLADLGHRLNETMLHTAH